MRTIHAPGKKYNDAVFFCHQSIEKQRKAVLLNQSAHNVFRTHDLKELYAQTQLNMPKEFTTFLLRLNPHYMVTRYPDVSGTAGYENYDEGIAKEFIDETRKALQWLKNAYWK